MLDCTNMFPRLNPVLLRRSTCCLYLYSIWVPGTEYLQLYRFGCGYESHLEQAAMKIWVRIHAFPCEHFIEDVRRLSEDCTREQGHEFLVQTHEDKTYALTYALIRDTEYFIAKLVLHKKAINSLFGLLKSSGSMWMCVIFIELTSKYECSLSDKAKGPWTFEVNRFV